MTDELGPEAIGRGFGPEKMKCAIARYHDLVIQRAPAAPTVHKTWRTIRPRSAGRGPGGEKEAVLVRAVLHIGCHDEHERRVTAQRPCASRVCTARERPGVAFCLPSGKAKHVELRVARTPRRGNRYLERAARRAMNRRRPIDVPRHLPESWLPQQLARRRPWPGPDAGGKPEGNDTGGPGPTLISSNAFLWMLLTPEQVERVARRGDTRLNTGASANWKVHAAAVSCKDLHAIAARSVIPRCLRVSREQPCAVHDSDAGSFQRI